MWVLVNSSFAALGPTRLDGAHVAKRAPIAIDGRDRRVGALLHLHHAPRSLVQL